ncbi:MAG: hypothetical protein EOO38_03180 [Cytophagaceae bacterium]|nr:MAG: hypothetical protein EOO38_03180 [Cytophagaceae bacterium]
MKLIVAVAVTALTGVAVAQSTTRDAANAVGRAASAAVTPGDQNMGRNPDNRSGGLLGDRNGAASGAATGVGRAASAAVTPGDQDMGRNSSNRSGGLMGNARTGSGSGVVDGTRPARAARADRG